MYTDLHSTAAEHQAVYFILGIVHQNEPYCTVRRVLMLQQRTNLCTRNFNL